MSSAFYPLGMKSYNNHTNQGGYISWKGTGVFSNPVGITAGNIRPLTNNDPLNNSNVGFGLPRPIKHYRKGRSIGNNNGVASSGGGSLIKQMIDIPGGYNIFPNTVNETSNTVNLNDHCNTCYGIGVISNWMPITNLTEKPETTTQTSTFCCNDEKKALRRTRPTNTKLKKKYYTTTSQYLYNRCKTYEQQQFNYITSGNSASKPGDPSSINNTYVGNCNPNLDIDNPVVDTDSSYNTLTNSQGCKVTQYKPNNYKFSTQGAVSSSDRILRLNVDTINTNNANIHSLNLQKSKYFQGGCEGVSSIFYIPNKIISETTNTGTCSALCPVPYQEPYVCPEISLSTIATITETNVWSLSQNTTILSCQTLTIPSGQRLNIPTGLTLTNNGTIENSGKLRNVNGTFINNANFTTSGIVNDATTTGTITNSSTGVIDNTGTFNIKAGDTFSNSGTIHIHTSVGIFKQYKDFTNSGTIYIYDSGDLQINTGIVLTNNGNIYYGVSPQCVVGKITLIGTGTIAGTTKQPVCPPQP